MGSGVAHQGVEAWNAGIPVIFGEELPIDEDLQIFVLLFEIDGDVGGKGNSREQGEGESKVERAHGVREEVKQGDPSEGRRNADCFPARFGPTCPPEER